MNKPMALHLWETETERLVSEFMKKYFPDYNYKEDCHWIGNEIGGVCMIGDYFFDLNRIIDALRHDISIKTFFNYYDYELELAHQDKRPEHNLRTYAKLKKSPV